VSGRFHYDWDPRLVEALDPFVDRDPLVHRLSSVAHDPARKARARTIARMAWCGAGPGWVYLIRAVSSGSLKIGHSNDPRRRLSNIQTAHTERLELLGGFRAPVQAETYLHGVFASLRILNEWYKPDDRIVHVVTSADWEWQAACTSGS
jgi:hypothetical protein